MTSVNLDIDYYCQESRNTTFKFYKKIKFKENRNH